MPIIYEKQHTPPPQILMRKNPKRDTKIMGQSLENYPLSNKNSTTMCYPIHNTKEENKLNFMILHYIHRIGF